MRSEPVGLRGVARSKAPSALAGPLRGLCKAPGVWHTPFTVEVAARVSNDYTCGCGSRIL